ncbi:MAG: exonuclease [Candidatus Marinimicrobia bacterium]|nr:exonuclease [Candidatus Neomarinimicrobiota bacterium]|tara:strand:+ start:546 stop:827 length:282 start_codon:yes stop_codon:yes gene_type:complete
MADMIKEPPHYTQHEIEPIDFIIKNKLDFCQGNVVKYICRYNLKGGIDDLLKAKQYIDFIIDKDNSKQLNLRYDGKTQAPSGTSSTKLTPKGY